MPKNLSFAALITCLWLGVLLSACTSPSIGGTPSPTPGLTSAQLTQRAFVPNATPRGSNPGGSLEQIDWRNFTYPFICFSDHAVSVTTKDGSASHNGVRYALIGVPVFGDLNGDYHQEEAVIVYRCARGDTEYNQALVYSGTALHPSLLATLPNRNDPLQSVELASIGDETLRLTGSAYAPKDPSCCPSLHIVESYKWNGKSFLLVASHSM